MITFTIKHLACACAFIMFIVQFCLQGPTFPIAYTVYNDYRQVIDYVPESIIHTTLAEVNRSHGYGENLKELIAYLQDNRGHKQAYLDSARVGFLGYISYRFDLSCKLFWWFYLLVFFLTAILTAKTKVYLINTYRRIPLPDYLLIKMPVALVVSEIGFLMVETSFPGVLALSFFISLFLMMLSALLSSYLFSNINPLHGKITNQTEGRH